MEIVYEFVQALRCALSISIRNNFSTFERRNKFRIQKIGDRRAQNAYDDSYNPSDYWAGEP
jgi:hypothetical protein